MHLLDGSQRIIFFANGGSSRSLRCISSVFAVSSVSEMIENRCWASHDSSGWVDTSQAGTNAQLQIHNFETFFTCPPILSQRSYLLRAGIETLFQGNKVGDTWHLMAFI